MKSAEQEAFIVVKVEDGFRVVSPLSPATQFVVLPHEDILGCSCEEYQRHANDPEWRCRHVIAVEKFIQQNGEPAGEPAAAAGNGDSNAPAPERKKAAPRGNGEMLIKRSISPDGRIDSLSVEISYPLGKSSAEEIKTRAASVIALQTEITETFRKKNGNGSAQAQRQSTPQGASAAPAQLVAVAGMDGKYGRRLFLNVSINGQISRFFGSAKQLGYALSAAGFPQFAANLSEGMQLNLPCRVTTKLSPDGKYTNIDRILPLNGGHP